MVAVVFIDLVGSSLAPDRRASLQRKLIDLSDHLNSLLGTRAALQVVWGDELKGVLLATMASPWRGPIPFPTSVR